MIDTQEDLKALVERAGKADSVAVDTEFVWERTYYPKLGLIQLGLSEDECYLIDAVALEDLSPLGPLLADPTTVKILHDARQDLVILRRATGAAPRHIFDTRKAAGFVGLTATLSLGGLLRKVVEVDLAKTESRTNWLRRPLSDRQVAYALDDVRYLPAARSALLHRVRQRKRERWLQDELALYDDPALYEERDPQEQFLRVKGTGRMTARHLAVLRALTAWREEEARRRDRPREHVLPDKVLTTLARQMPTSHDALHSIKGLSTKERQRFGKKIVKAVAAGLSAKEGSWPRPHKTSHNDELTQARANFAYAYMVGKSLGAGIDPGLVASRADLTAFVADGAAAPGAHHGLLSGWRKEFFGSELRQLMAGHHAVRLNPQNGLPELVAHHLVDGVS